MGLIFVSEKNNRKYCIIFSSNFRACQNFGMRHPFEYCLNRFCILHNAIIYLQMKIKKVRKNDFVFVYEYDGIILKSFR